MTLTHVSRFGGAAVLALGLLAAGPAAAQIDDPLFGDGFGPATPSGDEPAGGGLAGNPPAGGAGGALAGGPGGGLAGGGNPMARLEQMLQRLDSDGDGAITQAEAAAARQERFASIDRDGDGAIDVEEMRAAQDSRRTQRLQQMLGQLDGNGDGRVTAEEFESGQGAGRLFDRLDRNQDGTISQDEIEQARAMMQQRLVQRGFGQGQGGFGQGQGGFPGANQVPPPAGTDQ